MGKHKVEYFGQDFGWTTSGEVCRWFEAQFELYSSDPMKLVGERRLETSVGIDGQIRLQKHLRAKKISSSI